MWYVALSPQRWMLCFRRQKEGWMEIYNEKTTLRPIVPLRGMWVFPHMVIHFDAGREMSVKALDEALLRDSKVVLVSQKDYQVEEPTIDELYEIGTLAVIKQTFKLSNGNIRVLVEGESRVKIDKITSEKPFFEGEVTEYDYQADQVVMDDKLEAVMRLVLMDVQEFVSLNSQISKEVIFSLMDIDDPGRLADVIVSYMQLKQEEHYRILAEFDVYQRLESVHSILRNEIELAKIEENINQKVRKNINKSQKEYYLREQLQAIKTELGEDGMEEESFIEEYIERVKNSKMPEESKEHVLKEANRLRYASPGSPEINVIRTYLDYCLDLPWGVYTDEDIDIKNARKVLDQDHYGLKDVKERVLEFMAVRRLKKDQKGSILCLVGPPGVGKTSIVKSVAQSLQRNFVSMRLGGVRDEAEIRGHRKTYIGAMPGRIIVLMSKAGSQNPVFLFDEVDKLGSDYRGDPSSALLEVLDPAQNSDFIDHFIEIPFDLSQVMFVTTANSVQAIPAALRDRMEVITIAGYTEEEKFHIAKRHLWPKQLALHGIAPEQCTISDEGIYKIIQNYTREAGVRNLERSLAKIHRKVAKRIVEEGVASVRITKGTLTKYLGREKILDDNRPTEDTVGVVTGLAWTEVGGEILTIETNIMDGSGKVQLTGSLGDVMKESAMAAISYIRSESANLGVSGDFHEKKDIHIHIPEGAVPKDGPSAGVAMTTSVVSALTGQKIRCDLAMTGEVTIRGRVLPIGGVKEKVLAANRYGIKNIILPVENERDLDDIPVSIKRGIHFEFVSHVREVLDLALVKDQ